MSKTNTEKMAPETQTPEMTNGMKLDVRVRPIAPMGNLLAFANVTIGGCFKIDGFRICSSEKGLYVNMPATQDKGGNWKDVCWPVTAEFRKQLNDALIDGYGQAIENLQAKVEHVFTPAEVEALLSFQDPLDVARWCWEENNHEHSFPICDLLKEIDAEQKFEHFTSEPSAQDKYTLLMKRLGQNYFAYRESLMSKDKESFVKSSADRLQQGS